MTAGVLNAATGYETVIDLANKGFCIFGLKGSGKTELAKMILRSCPGSIAYDPVNDYIGFRRYRPTDRHSAAELSDFILIHVLKEKTPLLIIDEANKYVKPKPSPLPPGIADLNDLNRHYKVAWGLICRRAVQMHSDVTELAAYNFYFRLPGRLDKKILNDTWRGMGDACAELPDFHFIVYKQGQGYYKHKPITLLTPDVVAA